METPLAQRSAQPLQGTQLFERKLQPLRRAFWRPVQRDSCKRQLSRISGNAVTGRGFVQLKVSCCWPISHCLRDGFLRSAKQRLNTQFLQSISYKERA